MILKSKQEDPFQIEIVQLHQNKLRIKRLRDNLTSLTSSSDSPEENHTKDLKENKSCNNRKRRFELKFSEFEFTFEQDNHNQVQTRLQCKRWIENP